MAAGPRAGRTSGCAAGFRRIVLVHGGSYGGRITFTRAGTASTTSCGRVPKNAPTAVVINRCSFFNSHYSIYLQRGGSYWYIADNTIVGDTP